MFGTIRRHQTWLWAVIITLTVISFVIYFSPYSRTSDRRRGEGNFGSINGHRITEEEFVNAQRDIFLRYFFMSGGHWPDAETKKKGFDVEQQTYQWLLLLQEQERFNIHISTDAAAQFARQMMGQFSRNGSVPVAQFMQQVLQPKGFQSDDLDRFARHSLGLQELVATVGLNGNLVTTNEAKALYTRAFEEMSTEAVFFSGSNYMAEVSVTPEAISTFFYSNHLAEYRIPDRVQVNYVAFPLTNYLATANQELARLTNLDQQIDEAYRQNGTNLLREVKAVSLEDAKIKIREARRKEFQAQAARKAATDFATPLFGAETSRAEDFMNFARTNGLAVGLTAPFDREDGPKDLDVGPDFVQKAFSRTTTDPFAGPFVGQDAVYVIALNKKIPSEIPLLDQIRDRVVRDYKHIQALVKARMAGMDFHRTLTNSMAQGKSFVAACTEAKLKPVALPPFSLSTRFLPEVDVSMDQLKQLAFGTAPGKASGFQGTTDGGMILFVKAKLPLDEAKMQAELPAFMRQERQKRQDEAFNLWFSKEAGPGLRNTPLGRPQQPPPAMRPGSPAPAKS